jgi:hypothetical protein
MCSALSMILFAQPERAQIASGEVHYMFSYENYVHEAGFARLTISMIAAIILFIPYRRGERWAFVTLVILALAYYVPVFFFGAIPNLGTWSFFRNFPQQGSTGLFVFWSSYLLTGFLLLGLLLAAPGFVRVKRI